MIKAILAAWVLLLIVSLIGWGAFGFSLLPRSQRKVEGGYQSPHALLLGLFLVTFQGLVTNFWVPLTKYVGLYTIALGFGFFLWFHKRLTTETKEWALLGAAIVWVVWGLPFDSLFGDAALYHLQFEEWIANSPLLWGLANLQTRFGFDSTWLIFVSTIRVDLSPALSPWMHAIAADMMIRTFIVWWLLIGLSHSTKYSDQFGQVFYGAGFVFLSVLLWRMREAGTDIPTNLMAIALWIVAYEVWRKRQRSSCLQCGTVAIILVALIFTSKMSILPLTLLIVPVLYMLKVEWKNLFPVIIVSAIFAACWIYRNFVLTGCFIYPIEVTCIDVAWGLPPGSAKAEALSATTFARIHMGPAIILQRSMESVANFSIEWLTEWIKRFPATYYFRITFTAFLVGAIGWFAWGRKQRHASRAPFLLISALVTFVAFIYWLVFAPDPRFAWGIFYIASVSCVCGAWMRVGVVKTPFLRFIDSKNFPLIVIALGFFIGVMHKNLIDPFKHRLNEATSFEYRGVLFYLSPAGDCGERMPCVTGTFNRTAIDRIFDANHHSKIFYPIKN